MIRVALHLLSNSQTKLFLMKMVRFITWAFAMALAGAELTVGDIDREVSDGVKSAGFSLVYGDEHMMLINQVVSDAENIDVLKSKHSQLNEIEALPSQDVKCLMSVDRYCSKEMKEIKGVLVQAIKDDCQSCTTKQKEDAGKVVAAMLAHDSVAWKLFLTRYDGLDRVKRLFGSALSLLPRKQNSNKEEVKLQDIGSPEYVVASKSRQLGLGFNVRVKIFVSEKLS